MIKPWLILGPFYEDLSDRVDGLTLFERAGATVGETAMAEVIGEAHGVLAATPSEGDEAQFRGQTARWSLVRRPETYLSWGNYYISNHLGAAFLSTVVTPEQAGVHRWRLVTRITTRAVMAINGQVVFDSATQPKQQTRGTGGGFEYLFEAALQPGEQTLTVGLFRLARMAQVGCLLDVVGSTLQARVPLAAGVSPEIRAQVEEELSSISLGRDLVYPDDSINLKLGVAPDTATTLRVQLLSNTGELLKEAMPTVAGNVSLGRGDALADGRYKIVCIWFDHNDTPITSTEYAILKLTPTPRMDGVERLDERTQFVLEQYGAVKGEALSHNVIWPEVARYGLGRYDEVDEGVVGAICGYIAARKDCADFAIQGLLRLMYWEREQQRLTPALNALMKDTVLGFKYWVDEPGDTVMYMGSENHRLLFHVAEWMAGQLFPTEEFTNSQQRGLYHATKGRMYITEWLRQRGRFGFDEWHSNSYYPICTAPLINVYDFTIYEDDKLRQMTGAVLDYMHFNLAADSLNGVFGTTHGRSYARYLVHPDMEGTAAMNWLLFGVGAVAAGSSGMGPVSLATSRYRAPRILTDIATDTSGVIESKVRQGILNGTNRHANFAVYRTPDYLVSGLQDHRKGEYEPSTHVAQVTLANNVVIFWSCPHTSGEGSGLRPDYWSGHTTLPRVIQHRNVLALTWRLSEFAWMSHCFFEQDRFDEVRFAGDWAFGRVKSGYVGIYVQGGMSVGTGGQYAGRELICDTPEHTWLVECGREADWGSFDAFVQALESATIDAQDGVITYESPSIGRFITGWEVAPKVNGEPIQLGGYPMVDSPWAFAAFGSGELTIRHGDDEYEIWFNQ